jgi:MFS family permease
MSEKTTRSAWFLMLAAAGILMITTGSRLSLGLFIAPIDQTTGLGIASISFALAIGQFVWGAVQPLFGAVADQYGPTRVLMLGSLLLASGLALASIARDELTLILTLGLLSAAGAGAGSFSLLMGATSSQLPPEKRSFAAGFVNAGASIGQMLFAPLAQALIVGLGWTLALVSMGAITLATLPMILGLRSSPRDGSAPSMPSPPGGLRSQLQVALADRSYLLLHLSFFTCGVHIAFLVTHLPGEVGLCGLPPSVSANAISLIGLFNIVGSLTVGWLGGRFRQKNLLGLMYASRVVIIGLYLLAPRTPLTFYAFSIALGFSWLATVPPTAGIVGKLFGMRYFSTLFGLTLLSHQTGAFFGAWLGGVTRSQFGDYGWMWIADMVLAGIAALLCMPIREPRLTSAAEAAAPA